VRQERRDQARAVRAHKLRCGALPAPSQAELDQLVADFLARRGGVTRCPTVYGDGPHGRAARCRGRRAHRRGRAGQVPNGIEPLS
jgi:hypothetical protein